MKLRQYCFHTPQTPVKMLPIFCARTAPCWSMVTTPRSSSDIANMPIIAGMKLMPCSSSTLPKVKRGKPAAGSMPMQLIGRPNSSEAKPLSGSSVAMNTAQVNPSSASQKYSNEEKLIANSASSGAHDDQDRDAEQPADHREDQIDAEVEIELALLRHGVALVRVGGGGGRAGNAQHRGRECRRQKSPSRSR